MSDRSPPGIDHGRGTFVVVGCGAAKSDEPREARDLYTSNYFGLKRQFAEAATNWIPDTTNRGNGWMILSAKHGMWPPRVELDPYDTTIEDLDESDLDGWAKRVNAALIDWLRSPFRADEPEDSPCKNLIVLAGRKYIKPLLERDAFSAGEKHKYGVPAVPQFPFQELDLGGIGEQMAWLKEMVNVVESTPAEQAELGGFGGGYERDHAMWQLDRDPINVEETEQADLSAFEDVDERYIVTEQQPLPVAATDGGRSEVGTDHQVKCFNPDCRAIFDSVQEMYAVQGRGERCPRHFCESCFDEIRERNQPVQPDTDCSEGGAGQ